MEVLVERVESRFDLIAARPLPATQPSSSTRRGTEARRTRALPQSCHPEEPCPPLSFRGAPPLFCHSEERSRACPERMRGKESPSTGEGPSAIRPCGPAFAMTPTPVIPRRPSPLPVIPRRPQADEGSSPTGVDPSASLRFARVRARDDRGGVGNRVRDDPHPCHPEEAAGRRGIFPNRRTIPPLPVASLGFGFGMTAGGVGNRVRDDRVREQTHPREPAGHRMTPVS